MTGDSARTLWYSDDPHDYMYHGGSFADIDEDGLPEIVIGSYDGFVYVINAEDGSLEWSYPSPSYIGAPTSIADLNNDDHWEIIFVSYNQLMVLSHTGSLLWSYPTGGNIFRGAAVSDIDGDGILDVAFGSDDGILRVLRGDSGQVIWTYDLQAHYGKTFEMDHAPVIADFDNDGKLDIFVVGGYGVSDPPGINHGRAYALSAGDGTGPGWPMFRHDLHHSACFTVEESYICGDIDANGENPDVADLTYLVDYLFRSGPEPPVPEAANVNGTGGVNVADLTYLVDYLFKSGPALNCQPIS